MRPIKARYVLWQLMLTIAVLAGLFTVFGVAGAAAWLMVIGVLLAPILLAGPGGGLRALAWVASCFPLFVLTSLYTTWLTAWLVLGHWPQPRLDHPRSIGLLVEVPYLSTSLLARCVPLVVLLWIPLTLADTFLCIPLEKRHPSRMFAWLLVTLSACAFCFAVMRWNLFHGGAVLRWYLD